MSWKGTGGGGGANSAVIMEYINNSGDVKTVRVATTANITLSGTQTVDGVAVVAGNRVLVKNQTTASQNGIYAVATGSWTRATDHNTAPLINASAIAVTEGSTQANTVWKCNTNTSITVGTTALNFTRYAIHNITGGATTILNSNLTANRALLSDANGKIVVSAVTNAELGHLTGVTGAIQTQLNGKSDTTHTHTLTNLTDVTVTTPASGHTLRYNGTSWLNAFPTMNDNTDITLTSVANNHILQYNGTVWVNRTLATAGIAPLASPTFTGTPVAPTASAGTNTTQIATTAFVTGALSGKANTNHNHDMSSLTDTTIGTLSTGHTLRWTGTDWANQFPTLLDNSDVTLTNPASGHIIRHNGTNWVNATLATAGIAPLASPALTGTPTAPTATSGTNTTQLATTAFVQTAISGLSSGGSGLPAGGTTAHYLRGDSTWQTLNATAVGLGNVTNESKATMFASPTFTGTPVAPTASAGTNTTQVATTAFVTGAISTVNDFINNSGDVKLVRVATTANITLSGTQTIDGVSVAVGDRVLVKNQTTASANGVYVVASGAWTRATDHNSAQLINASSIAVTDGNTQSKSMWKCNTSTAITVGTTALNFVRGGIYELNLANTGLTASRTLVTDANGKLTISAVTSTELGRLSGVTSAIQTQINAKANLANPSFTGVITYEGVVLPRIHISTVNPTENDGQNGDIWFVYQ